MLKQRGAQKIANVQGSRITVVPTLMCCTLLQALRSVVQDIWSKQHSTCYLVPSLLRRTTAWGLKWRERNHYWVKNQTRTVVLGRTNGIPVCMIYDQTVIKMWHVLQMLHICELPVDAALIWCMILETRLHLQKQVTRTWHLLETNINVCQN